MARSGCFFGIRASRSTYENNAPERSSKPRIRKRLRRTQRQRITELPSALRLFQQPASRARTSDGTVEEYSYRVSIFTAAPYFADNKSIPIRPGIGRITKPPPGTFPIYRRRELICVVPPLKKSPMDFTSPGERIGGFAPF